jgi:hypothetical protein
VLAAVTWLLLMASGAAAQNATAAKVKQKAPYIFSNIASYAGGALRVDLLISSKNRHCKDGLRSGLVKFFLTPDGEYPDLSDGGLWSYAETNYLPLKLVGRGHIRFQAPGTARFDTHYPGGQYSGTYTWNTWWTYYGYTPGFDGRDYTNAQYDTNAYHPGGRRFSPEFKVRYKKGGVKHVVECVHKGDREGQRPGL